MESRKVSLYLRRETMNELLRLKNLIILAGKATSETPEMNEYISGIIAYTSKILREYPPERERFQEFMKGKVRPTTRENEIESIDSDEEPEEYGRIEITEEEKGTARFLYKISEIEEKELKEITELSKTETTAGILIRTVIEYCLREKIDKKSITLYFFLSTLYNISIQTTITLFFTKNEDEDIKKINRKDKEALRKITWDHGAFEVFKKALEQEKKFVLTYKTGKMTGGKLQWIFGIRPKTFYKNTEETNSKASNFNYMIAYSGLTMSLGIIEKELTSITEGIIQINELKKTTYKKLTDIISYLISISDKINNNPEI
jgi:hypothetical protein